MKPGSYIPVNGPIPWPDIEALSGITSTADAQPPDPDDDVLPEEVEALIRAIEDQAARLRNAAEVHFMRQRYPGYRNRSYRRHTAGRLLEFLWDQEIEYAPGSARGLTALISSPPWYERLFRSIFG